MPDYEVSIDIAVAPETASGGGASHSGAHLCADAGADWPEHLHVHAELRVRACVLRFMFSLLN